MNYKFYLTIFLRFVDQGHEEGVGCYQEFAVVCIVPFVLLKGSAHHEHPDAESQDRPQLLKETGDVGISYNI